jgi:signal transduction histidine kinase
VATAAEQLRACLAAARAALAREQAEAEQGLQTARAALAQESGRAEQLRARLLADALPAGDALRELVAAFAEATTRRATLHASAESWAYRQLVLAEQARALADLESRLSSLVAQLDGTVTLHDWLRSQERGRAQLAAWLHDRVAQPLHHLVLQLGVAQRCWPEDPARAAAELATVPPLVERLLAAVRRAIFELRPMALDDLGLVPTLEQYIQLRAAEEGLVARLQVQGPLRRLPAAAELALFRIVAAALDNVRDHAGTREALLDLRFGEHALEMTIADHGRGCNLDTDRPVGGGGWSAMRLRAEQVGGRITFESSPGHGLVVRVTVPWHDAALSGPRR